MINAFDFSIPQYAVIEARGMDGPSERLVIAYSDEEALRDLIAGPGIIGCGFSTREQAQGHADYGGRLKANSHRVGAQRAVET